MKPVKCKHFGKEYRYPYVLEEDFMVDDLIQLTMQELLVGFNQLGREDQTNNAKDNFKPNEK